MSIEYRWGLLPRRAGDPERDLGGILRGEPDGRLRGGGDRFPLRVLVDDRQPFAIRAACTARRSRSRRARGGWGRSPSWSGWRRSRPGGRYSRATSNSPIRGVGSRNWSWFPLPGRSPGAAGQSGREGRPFRSLRNLRGEAGRELDLNLLEASESDVVPQHLADQDSPSRLPRDADRRPDVDLPLLERDRRLKTPSLRGRAARWSGGGRRTRRGRRGGPRRGDPRSPGDRE